VANFASRWQGGNWSAWKNVSTTKAKGAPGLVAIGSAGGRLYYTDETGTVIELSTTDSGTTWT